MRLIPSFLLTAAAFAAAPAAHADEALESNPYVVLYRQRLEVAKVDVEKQRATYANEQAKLDRLKKLLINNYVSREEYDAQATATKLAGLEVDGLDARVKEADAMVGVAKARINSGLDMPICSAGE